MPPQSSLVHQIKEEARRLGFDAVGIARLSTPLSSISLLSGQDPISFRGLTDNFAIMGTSEKMAGIGFSWNYGMDVEKPETPV